MKEFIGRKMNLKDASRIFTSRQLSIVASGDYSLLESVNSLFFSNYYGSVEDLYSGVYKLCEREYRNEFIYKNVLIDKLLFKIHSPKTSSLITEFRVGNSKADFVLLNGKSKCYEIKTEYDTLSKLETQVEDYLRVFDDVNIVLHEKHISAAFKMLPESVNVYNLQKNNTLTLLQRANNRNYDRFEIKTLINSLRLPELKDICGSLTGESINVNNINIYRHCHQVLASFSDLEIKNEFRKVLKRTRKNDLNTIESLPSYLLAAVITYKFKKVELKQLIKLFSTLNTVKDANVFSNIERETV
jgi:hypothetical protein